MAIVVLSDARIILDAYDISTDLNQIKASTTPDMLENTSFGSTYHTSSFGLIKTDISMTGFVQNGTAPDLIEEILHTRLIAGSAWPVTVSAEGGDAGEGCLFAKQIITQYEWGGTVGELDKFTAALSNSNDLVDNPLVRGYIFEDGNTARVIAGNTSTIEMGAVAAGQYLYAAIHLTAFTATNLTFTLKSAVTDWGTPSTRITFTQNTGIGSQYATRVAGPITDAYWRFEWTATGLTSFRAVLVAGIQ